MSSLRALAAVGIIAGAGGILFSVTDVFSSSALSGAMQAAVPTDLEAQQPVMPQVMLVSAFNERKLATQQGEDAGKLVELDLEVKSGDTLMDMLVKAGAQPAEAHQAITVLRDVFSPRDLRPGQKIQLGLENAVADAADAPATARLVSLRLRSSVEEDVEVSRDTDGFVARAIARPLAPRDAVGTATINSSLYQAAVDAGVPQSVLADAIRVLSFDVDFQREIQPDDSFEIFYEGLHDDSGVLVKTEEPLFVEVVLSGKPVRLYRYTPKSGVPDYFDEKGQSVRKTLMRTPIDGARLSSGYGMRKHPILGYSRMHKGVDFAAPRGTPIYAAGDGVVEMAGRNGGYGNYVRLRHTGSYKTAYAHMRGFAKGIRAGVRVKQGQVIGYVGTTGRSTGPHLHYEVLVDNKQTNPRSIKLPSGEILKGADLKAYEVARQDIDRRREAALTRTQIASNRSGDGALCAATTAGDDGTC